MLRTQKDVDKHVQEVLRKITNEKEVRLVAGGSQYLQVGGLDAGFSLCWTFVPVNRVASAFKFVVLYVTISVIEVHAPLTSRKCF